MSSQLPFSSAGLLCLDLQGLGAQLVFLFVVGRVKGWLTEKSLHPKFLSVPCQSHLPKIFSVIKNHVFTVKMQL